MLMTAKSVWLGCSTKDSVMKAEMIGLAEK